MQNRLLKPGFLRSVSFVFPVLLSLLVCGDSVSAEPERSHAGKDEPLRTDAVERPKYWLGVQCRPVDEAMHAHLELPETHGLLVGEVVPGSPASKAGIKRHDVILTAAGSPLATPGDLVQAVESTGEKPLSLEVFRRGEVKKIAVTPSRRPKDLAGHGGIEGPEAIGELFEELKTEPGKSMRFRFIRPGMILPHDAPCHPPLPDDVTVSIEKTGDKPLRITVTKKDRKWEVNEDELHTLPDEIRRYAEQMLGRTTIGPADPVELFDFFPDWAAGGATQDAMIEQRLEAMNRQLDQLRRGMEQLRGEQRGDPAEK